MSEQNYTSLIEFIKTLYPNENPVPLHAPRFYGNETKYLSDCIETTFVSYVGQYVIRMEELVKEITGAKYAFAVVNGTEALHIALLLAGVKPGEEVITQALTFIATANAIKYCNADPIFIDVDKETLGMSPDALDNFLRNNAILQNGMTINRKTGRRIASCVPMHTFGHPVCIEEIVRICNYYSIPVVEDSAESLGSYRNGKHTGTFGRLGIFSFNGNKVVTTGGGGMVITDDESLALRGKHLTTTAKIPHPLEYIHDEIGYNFRLPNINAAIGCAQLEMLKKSLENKRETALFYKSFCDNNGYQFVNEPSDCKSNFWLNAVLMNDIDQRNLFLKLCSENGIQARPVWKLMNQLEMYKKCQNDKLVNSSFIAERLVNIPSSIRK